MGCRKDLHCSTLLPASQCDTVQDLHVDSFSKLCDRVSGLLSYYCSGYKNIVFENRCMWIQLDSSYFLPVNTIVVDWTECKQSTKIVMPLEDKVIWSVSIMTLANIII